MDLPPELRFMIWGYTVEDLVNQTNIKCDKKPEHNHMGKVRVVSPLLSLKLVSKQVKNDIETIVEVRYRANTYLRFISCHGSPCMDLAEKCCPLAVRGQAEDYEEVEGKRALADLIQAMHEHEQRMQRLNR